MQNSDNKSIDTYLVSRATNKLYDYLLRTHVHNGRVIGPDIGLRWNKVLFHLIKSYIHFVPWNDNYIFMQSLAYWININCRRYQTFRDSESLELIKDAAKCIVSLQRPEGHWTYPLKAWEDKIATVEGNFAALGLIDAYEITNEKVYLESATLWIDCLLKNIGFIEYGTDGLAIKYFAEDRKGAVPNNTTLTLKLLSRSKQVSISTNRVTSEEINKLAHFLACCQLNSGELPYQLRNKSSKGRTHYQCFQYNAFEFLDLCDTIDVLELNALPSVIYGLAKFISVGVKKNGSCRFSCYKDSPQVTYHASAVGAALHEATKRDLGNYSELSSRCCNYVLSKQLKDGSMPWSENEYGILKDARRYPRNLLMTLDHLLRIQGWRL